jgi:thioredoxin 2
VRPALEPRRRSRSSLDVSSQSGRSDAYRSGDDGLGPPEPTLRGDCQPGEPVSYGSILAWRVYPGSMPIISCPNCGARNRVRPIPSGFPRCPKCRSELPWVVDADAETFTAETAATVPVVVDFWAAWCGPCRMIAPVLEDLARRHAGHLKVVKVDVDANRGLAARFGAQSIPLLVVIRDGREVDRIVGALPRAALEQRLGSVLAA